MVKLQPTRSIQVACKHCSMVPSINFGQNQTTRADNVAVHMGYKPDECVQAADLLCRLQTMQRAWQRLVNVSITLQFATELKATLQKPNRHQQQQFIRSSDAISISRNANRKKDKSTNIILFRTFSKIMLLFPVTVQQFHFWLRGC